MPQSLAKIIVHTVFSTKDRRLAGQEVHHSEASFQEEFRALLGRYEIAFDERYVWD